MIRLKSWIPSLSSVALCAAIAACEGIETETRPPAVTIRDSAGIEIVDNHAPEWDDGSAWTVAPTPEIVIGGQHGAVDADSSHLVWRIGDVVALSDGRIALLSGGEKRVFLFESSGAF